MDTDKTNLQIPTSKRQRSSKLLNPNFAIEPRTLAWRANRPGSQQLAMITADSLPAIFLTVTAADVDRPRASDKGRGHAIKAEAR